VDNPAMPDRAESATVRRVGPAEAMALREVRLRALAQAPEAFAMDVAHESRHEPAHWEALAADDAEHVVLVAEDDDGHLAGMAGGHWRDRERGVAQLWGLWVDPALRGSGAGAALVRGILAWATGAGARFVRLGVIDPGGEAVTVFYERLGFVALDEPSPMRTDPSRLVTYMARPV
jgi:GNAT superfamily N-acetyltransferase